MQTVHYKQYMEVTDEEWAKIQEADEAGDDDFFKDFAELRIDPVDVYDGDDFDGADVEVVLDKEDEATA